MAIIISSDSESDLEADINLRTPINKTPKCTASNSRIDSSDDEEEFRQNNRLKRKKNLSSLMRKRRQKLGENSDSDFDEINKDRFSMPDPYSEGDDFVASDETFEQDDSFIIDDTLSNGNAEKSNDSLEESAISEQKFDLAHELSFFKTQTLEESFGLVVEYISILKADPSFSLHEYPSYEKAFRRITDDLSSRKVSLVSSSVWTPEFKRNLDGLPKIIYSDLSHMDYESCEICHRETRHACCILELTGSRYDKQTFQDIKKDPEACKYYAGRFCFERVRLYHQFQHFLKHLYASVPSIDLSDEDDHVPSAFIEQWFDKFQSLKDLAHSRFVP